MLGPLWVPACIFLTSLRSAISVSYRQPYLLGSSDIYSLADSLSIVRFYRFQGLKGLSPATIASFRGQPLR